MRVVYAVAAVAMAIPIFVDDSRILLFSFCIFEVCVGLFWPAIGTLRAKFLPEEGRATLMNMFRIPLNAIVCLILVKQGDLAVSTVFGFCSAFHVVCAVLQCWLYAKFVETKEVPAGLDLTA